MKPVEYYHNRYWQFCSLHPFTLKPQHAGVYFYIIGLAATLGYKESFALPAYNAMLYLGIKDYRLYSKCIAKLVACKLLFIVEQSKNQYTASIVAIEENAIGNKNAIALNAVSGKNAIEQNAMPNKNNNSDKQLFLDTKNSRNNWHGKNCSEKHTITDDVDIIRTTTKGKNAHAQNAEYNVSPIPPPQIIIPAIALYKAGALQDTGFTNEFRGMFPQDDYLPLWLEVFNKRINFTGALHRSEQQYRQHFTSWIFKVPNYSTIHPSSYDLLNRKETQTSTLSETAQYFINLSKNKSPG